MKKKIYVTGVSGQVGGELRRLFPGAIYLSRNEIDLNSERSIQEYFKKETPEIIINCAAYTKVDQAEKEIEQAFQVNSVAPAVLASLCKKFIHFSTDYVFDGIGHKPYSEDMKTDPASVYGESKLAGEQNVLSVNSQAVIIRTSWVYSDIGNNFVKTILRIARERKILKIVGDQIGSPTSARDLAKVVFENGILDWKFSPGIYHYSNEGVASWYDFACEIIEMANLECEAVSIRSEEYPTAAKRPYYSLLDKSKIKSDLKIHIPHWKESLRTCLLKLI